MTESQCNECGSNVFIVEYYNTEMDHTTSLDVMSGHWVHRNKDAIEQVDCMKCGNMIIPPDELWHLKRLNSKNFIWVRAVVVNTAASV